MAAKPTTNQTKMGPELPTLTLNPETCQQFLRLVDSVERNTQRRRGRKPKASTPR